MTAAPSTPDSPGFAQSELAQMIEELTARLQAGESIDVEAYVRRCPGGAEEIRQLLPALRMLADLGSSGAARVPATSADDPTARLGELGDFRLIREIGRGGMGIVYEAEQISLGRCVALKVLPFAATLDPRQLQRFKNEAHAAAHLHHQSIVPVHAVGCERGVHYYAMQFISGKTLAALIRELRDQAMSPESNRLAAAGGETPPIEPSPSTVDLPTGMSFRDASYFRTVARLGIQAAEALEHAHQVGIVHRDIKPANLLLDERGQLWITDFGLACIQGDAKLTMTGDLVGTLRYMSPEQALGQRGLIGHRADIYALGVTLYELLTLEPALMGDDRQDLLRQIAFAEPKPPRRWNASIPPELETIVLKAMRKEADERYATAQELADDLRRFLEDRPIYARRPTVLERARKWTRRHRSLVWTAVVSLVAATVVALAAHGVLISREQRDTANALAAEKQAKQELKEAWDREREARFRSTLAVARRYWLSDNLDLARAELEDCPPEQRDSEWRWLYRVCAGEVRRIDAHNLGVSVVQFSPDGQFLVTVGSDPFDKRDVKPGLWTRPVEHQAKVWDAVTGEQRSILRPPTKNFRSLAFSLDGEHLISAVSFVDGRKAKEIKDTPGWAPEFQTEVIVWDWKKKKPIGGFKQEEAIPAALVSPDGRRVALLPRVAGDLSISVYDPTSDQKLFHLGEGKEVGVGLVYRDDGQVLATWGAPTTPLRLWDTTSGELLRALPLAEFNIYRYALSPDGRWVAGIGHPLGGGVKPVEVRLWDAVTGRQAGSLGKTLRTTNLLCFSRDSRRLAVAGEGVSIWDLQHRKETLVFRRIGNESATSVAFSPDDQRLALGTMAGHVRIYDVSPLD